MKNLVFALGLLLLASYGLAQRCSTPPTCPKGFTCVEVGSDAPLKAGIKFYWLNSFTQDRALVVFSPDPLKESAYIVPACGHKKANVLGSASPGTYPYSATESGPCLTDSDCSRTQPRIKISQ
jgi:hypothetical protein